MRVLDPTLSIVATLRKAPRRSGESVFRASHRPLNSSISATSFTRSGPRVSRGSRTAGRLRYPISYPIIPDNTRFGSSWIWLWDLNCECAQTAKPNVGKLAKLSILDKLPNYPINPAWTLFPTPSPPAPARRRPSWRVVTSCAETIRVAIAGCGAGCRPRSVMLVGLRGVGKTVLLDRMRDDAERDGIHTLRMEAPEGRSLPALLAPQLRQALLRLSRNERALELSRTRAARPRGLRESLKVKYADIEVGLDLRSRARPGRQRRPGTRPTGAAGGGGRGGQGGGHGVRASSSTSCSMCGRGARGPDHRAPPDGAAPTSRHPDRCRPAATARPHGRGQVLCRAHVRVSRDRRLAARGGQGRDHQAATGPGRRRLRPRRWSGS